MRHGFGNPDEAARGHKADAKVFKALCNPYRLQALELLRSGEKCACDLLDHIDVSQSTLSHHIPIAIGLVCMMHSPLAKVDYAKSRSSRAPGWHIGWGLATRA